MTDAATLNHVGGLVVVHRIYITRRAKLHPYASNMLTTFKTFYLLLKSKGLQKARGPRPALGPARPEPFYGAGWAAGLNLGPARSPTLRPGP